MASASGHSNRGGTEEARRTRIRREHAKRIRDAAHQAIGAMQASKWEFLSETADGFQGGERDLILFGLVGGGDGQARTPPFYLKERNRFNVAISRARLHLNVFGDRQWARQSGVPVLSALADAAGTGPRESQGEFRSDLVGPVWEPRLAEALREEGISFRQQYQAAGFYLDFAFFGEGGRRVNVEVDGETYHRDRDGNLREEDVRRDLVLRADGWTVKRYWVYQLREDWDSCIQEIKRLISNH
jgi:very-short-patch-repair endonuclease